MTTYSFTKIYLSQSKPKFISRKIVLKRYWLLLHRYMTKGSLKEVSRIIAIFLSTFRHANLRRNERRDLCVLQALTFFEHPAQCVNFLLLKESRSILVLSLSLSSFDIFIFLFHLFILNLTIFLCNSWLDLRFHLNMFKMNLTREAI